MSYKFRLHSAFAVPLNFKWKDHQHLAHVFFDLLHATRAPGPELRADVVNHRNAAPIKLFGQPKVEVREVNQHRGVGPATVYRTKDLAKLAVNPGQMRYHFRQTDH